VQSAAVPLLLLHPLYALVVMLMKTAHALHNHVSHLFREPIGCYKLQCFHLPKVCGIAQHVYVHQLGNVPVPVARILLAKRLTKGCTLFCNDISFLCLCLAGANSPDELSEQQQRNRTTAVPTSWLVIGWPYHAVRCY
jgi:hypothetical protein